MSNIAIKFENLSKMYRLGVINNGTLIQDIQSWIARKIGKVDPNSKIGDERYEVDGDKFWALKNISHEIKQGDRVGIIGKNGAGKSTLLKLLSRISSPTEGIIKIKGKIASLLEVGTGFHGELTGRENIYLNGAILGMKVKRINEKINQIIEFSGIEHHIDTPVKRYSSGMYVRLAFAVAAHLDSDILIADEVLAVGDKDFQDRALGKMEDLSTSEGRTVLFVSHNMPMIAKLCNTSILMEKGKIINSGNTSDIIEFYHETKKSYKKENISRIERRNIDSPMYINSIYTCDDNVKEKSIFSFSDDIHLRIGVSIEKLDPNFILTISLISNNETIVFADYKYIKDICENNSTDIILGYKIKGSFIAPSNYTFNIRIANKDSIIVYDLLTNICPIKIYDNGINSIYSYDNYHYGFFIVHDECEWTRIK